MVSGLRPQLPSLIVREVASHSRLLLAALACGLLAAATPLFVRHDPERAEELQFTIALGLALAWMAFLAIGLGVSCLTRELPRGGASFDMTRPAALTSIWFARLAGALLTTLLAGALAMFASAASRSLPDRIPDLLASVLPGGSSARIGSWWISVMPWTLTGAVLFVLLVANLAGLVVMARDGWSVITLASVAAALPASIHWIGRLQASGATSQAHRLLEWNVLALVAALLIASHRQWVRGRTDLAAASRGFATALGAVLLATVLASAGYVEWYLRPGIGALNPRRVRAEELTSRLVSVEGVPRGRALSFRFLLDPESGRYIRLGPAVELPDRTGQTGFAPRTRVGFSRDLVQQWTSRPLRSPMLSADGSTIVWLDALARRSMAELVRRSIEVRIGRETPEVGGVRSYSASADRSFETARPIGPELAAIPSGWDLSRDGRLLALLTAAESEESAALEVVDTRSGSSPHSFSLPECSDPGEVHFESSTQLALSCGRACCVSHGPQPLHLREVQLGSGLVVRRQGYFDKSHRGPITGFGTVDVRFELVRGERLGDPYRWMCIRRGVEVAVDEPLGGSEWGAPSAVRRLPNGELLVTMDGYRQGAVAIYSPTGRARWWTPLPDLYLRILDSPPGTSPTVAFVEGRTPRFETRDRIIRPLPELRRALRIDLLDGEIVEAAIPAPAPLAPKAPRRRHLFLDPAGDYQWVDSASGQRHPLPVGSHLEELLHRLSSTGRSSTARVETTP